MHSATELLLALGYCEGELFHARVLHPDPGASGNFSYYVRSAGNLESIAGMDYYFAPNGGPKDADVELCRAIFYEHDDLSKDAQIELWKTLGLPEPTIQVDTGNKSIHSYWTFEQPIDVALWRELQADLLEFADADRSIKNPSRIMRLPGYAHSKTGKLCTIATNSGKRYHYHELRQLVPKRQKASLPAPTRGGVDGAFPLRLALSPDNRRRLQGVGSNRNQEMYELASDLVGLTQRLPALGIDYSSEALDLFQLACANCTTGGGWNENEWRSIWRSAMKRSDGPTMSDEKILGCWQAWQGPAKSADPLPPAKLVKQEKSEKESEDRSEQSFDDGFDELMQQVANVLKLAEPRKSYALSKLAKRNGIQESRLISWYFSDTNGKDQSRRFSGSDFMAMEFDEQEWFIRGLVPKSSAILVTASPGTGKSYLSYAFAKAILSGDGLDGRISCKGRVLILQGDEGMRNTHKKLTRLEMAEHGDDWEIDFGYALTDLPDLERRLVEGRRDFLICDSYATLNRHCGFEEKDTGFANTAMEVRAMCDRLGVTVILIHHLNKNGTTRGTTALEANVDEVIRLTREEEKSDARRFMGWCNSRSECQEYLEILYDDETGELRLVEAEDEGDDRDSRPASVEEKAMLQFRHNKGTWYEIDELVMKFGSTYNHLRQKLAKLYKQGKVEREQRYPDPENKSKWFYVYGISPPHTPPTSDASIASDDTTPTEATEPSEATEPPPPRGGDTPSDDMPSDVYEEYLEADVKLHGSEGLPRDRDTSELFDTSEYEDDDDDYSAPGGWD